MQLCIFLHLLSFFYLLKFNLKFLFFLRASCTSWSWSSVAKLAVKWNVFLCAFYILHCWNTICTAYNLNFHGVKPQFTFRSEFSGIFTLALGTFGFKGVHVLSYIKQSHLDFPDMNCVPLLSCQAVLEVFEWGKALLKQRWWFISLEILLTLIFSHYGF